VRCSGCSGFCSRSASRGRRGGSWIGRRSSSTRRTRSAPRTCGPTLIDEPHAGDLRQTLREYTEHRTRIQGALLADTLDEFMSAVPAFHERMWAAARDGSLARPEVTEPVVNAVNDVIDMHTLRLAAYKHLQTPVLVLLLVCSVLTLGVIGYACGVGGSRNALMTTVIAVLIASTLLITVDLDNARVGLIRMSDAPLAELDLGE
jgi:hypothetical protein